MGKIKQISLVKSSLTITAIMLIAKLISFARDMVMANYLGATELSDVILLSTSLLMAITSFVRSPFQAAYLPIATDVFILEKDEKKKGQFFGSVYGCAVIVGIIISAVIGLLLSDIVKVLAPGLSEEGKSTLLTLMRIEIPVIIFSFLAAVNDGNLKLLNRFGISEISAAILASVYIVYFFVVGESVSVTVLGIVVVSAYLLIFIFRYYVVVNGGIHYKWRFQFWKESNLKKIFFAMIPFFLATCATELNVIVDKAVASMLSPGSITMQSYASKITVTEVGLIATAISMVIYTQVAKDNTNENKNALHKTVVSGISFVNTVMLPCCAFTVIFSYEIIKVLFGRGEFTIDSIMITANTMVIYAIGMFGAGMEEIFTRTMHATKHRKYPATVSIITVFLNTGLNLLLYRKFGIYGLAAASSFVLLIRVPLYYYYVNKYIVKFNFWTDIGKDLTKIILSTAVACFAALTVKKLIGNMFHYSILVLLIGGVIGGCTYFAILLLLKNSFAIRAINKLLNKH